MKVDSPCDENDLSYEASTFEPAIALGFETWEIVWPNG